MIDATKRKKTPKQIQRALRSVNLKIAKLVEAKNRIIEECDHADVTRVYKSNTGNWCPQDDSYWTEFTCNTCGKNGTRMGVFLHELDQC